MTFRAQHLGNGFQGGKENCSTAMAYSIKRGRDATIKGERGVNQGAAGEKMGTKKDDQHAPQKGCARRKESGEGAIPSTATTF